MTPDELVAHYRSVAARVQTPAAKAAARAKRKPKPPPVYDPWTEDEYAIVSDESLSDRTIAQRTGRGLRDVQARRRQVRALYTQEQRNNQAWHTVAGRR